MTLLLVGIGITMAASGLLMEVLERAYNAPAYADHRFRAPLPLRATESEVRRIFAVNSALSVVLIMGGAWFGFGWCFVDTPMSAGAIALQTVGILISYDLLYYAAHRWIFHDVRLMKYMHGLHHKARTPSARESMYTHPMELTSGLALLLFCTWLVGPVHVVAFSVAFFIYSLTNVIIHVGVAFPNAPLSWMNVLSRHHHGHHGENVNRNFGSITPFWDWLFATRL